MKSSAVASLLCAAVIAIGNQCLADESPPASEDASQADVRQKLHALKWVNGPQKVQLFGNSALQVPADYVFLDQAETAKLQALQHNLSNGTEYFFAPKDGRWEVFFSYSDDGYVKDDEKIDAAALLKNIEENTVAGNKMRRSRLG